MGGSRPLVVKKAASGRRNSCAAVPSAVIRRLSSAAHSAPAAATSALRARRAAAHAQVPRHAAPAEQPLVGLRKQAGRRRALSNAGGAPSVMAWLRVLWSPNCRCRQCNRNAQPTSAAPAVCPCPVTPCLHTCLPPSPPPIRPHAAPAPAAARASCCRPGSPHSREWRCPWRLTPGSSLSPGRISARKCTGGCRAQCAGQRQVGAGRARPRQRGLLAAGGWGPVGPALALTTEPRSLTTHLTLHLP